MAITKAATLAEIIIRFDEQGNIIDRTRNDRIVVRDGDAVISQGFQGANMSAEELAGIIGGTAAGLIGQVEGLQAEKIDLESQVASLAIVTAARDAALAQVADLQAHVEALRNPPTPAMTLPEYAAKARWEKEVGGIMVSGIPVPTDDRAKLLILGAAQTLEDADEAPFIAGGVNYGMLTGAQFRGLSQAIVAHVQATFATLATVLAGIAAETITTRAEVDAAFAA